MRTAVAGLTAILNNNRTHFVADLYTFTLIDATVLRYTSADINLTVGGNTYLSAQPSGGAPILKRGRVSWRRGIQVDTLEIKLIGSTQHTVFGLPWMQFIRNGGLDGGRVTVDRFITDAWTNTANGALKWFAGNISEVSSSRTEASISVKNDLELLNVKIPGQVYQQGCRHTLFDGGCGLVKATFALARTANAGSTLTRILTTSAGQAAGYFDLGFLFFTSGPNAGAYRTIKKWDGAGLDLSLPLLSAPAAGNAFTIYPGCDKLKTTCTTKFNNLIRYGGFPYIPVPETAV